MNPADGPPIDFADESEPMFVLVETSHGSGEYEVVDYLGAMWEVVTGANEQMPTAKLSVNLGLNPNALDGDEGDGVPIDWQVQLATGEAVNAWDALLTGRRIMICTLRTNPGSDWLPFFGMINKIEPGYSGASKDRARWATAYAASIAEHGDAEPGQCQIGQWRRSRRAELALREQLAGGEFETISNECLQVTAEPVIFNPGGRPNCCKHPLVFGTIIEGQTEEHVYVFTDVDAPDSEHWTVARMLRYVEWTAMQPPPNLDGELYDYERYSIDQGPTALQTDGYWTTYGFLHENLDALIEDLLDQVYAVGSTPREKALLRILPEVAIDHFTTNESLIMVGERAGVAFSIRHASDMLGESVSTIYCWAIRGDHETQVNARTIGGGRGKSLPEVTPAEGESEPAPGVDPIDPSVLGLYIYVPKDGYSSVGKEFHEVVLDENSTEGGLVLDESAIRNVIRVQGDADEFEGAWELRPGWKPDTWVDVDPDDAGAVSAAVARLSGEFQTRFNLDKMSGAAKVTDGHILRRWVLNEHGYYAADGYKRDAGPWSSEEAWEPYKFRAEGNLCTLANRGDNGCCLRRRRFLPTTAKWWNEGEVDPVELGVLIEVSFDGGNSWWLDVAKIYNEKNECAITFTSNDLTTIAGGNSDDPKFAEAYIKGLLRIRVLANIASDDAVMGAAWWRESSPLAFVVADHVSRRGQLRRRFRYAPGGGMAANSVLPGYGVLLPLNGDDGPEARNTAVRLRNELEARRVSGRVTIPYLMADGTGPWPGYRVGDEVLGIMTTDEGSYMPLRGSDDPSKPGARIVSITHTYREDPPERATTLHIEDAGFEHAEHVPGDPRPKPQLTPALLSLMTMGAV